MSLTLRTGTRSAPHSLVAASYRRSTALDWLAVGVPIDLSASLSPADVGFGRLFWRIHDGVVVGDAQTGRIVLGLEPPDRGEVRFDGRPMAAPGTAEWRRQRARMQMIFQDPLGALDRRLPVAAQIREPLDIHSLGTPPEREDRVRELLRAVELSPAHGGRYLVRGGRSEVLDGDWTPRRESHRRTPRLTTRRDAGP